MQAKPLTEVRRRPVSEILNLRSDNRTTSIEAGTSLISEARSFGLDLRQFLDLALDPSMDENPEQYLVNDTFLSGYEASLAALQLPVRDQFSSGHVLDLAADTFQTYPGTRALFPEVIDDVVQWKYRQDHIENISAIVSQSRTINGVELLSTVVDDQGSDYQGRPRRGRDGSCPGENDPHEPTERDLPQTWWWSAHLV